MKNRLHCWMCTLVALFFCFVFLPRAAFAVDAAPAGAALVHVATITAENPAEGWYTWKRQSQAYKKAHPWEGVNGVWCTNSTRLNIPCTEAAWKKVPAGTIFLLPAPDVEVYMMSESATPPEAIMLRPTDHPQLFAPDFRPDAETQKSVLLAAVSKAREDALVQRFASFGLACLAVVLMLIIALLVVIESKKGRLLREAHESLDRLQQELHEARAQAASASRCAPADAPKCCDAAPKAPVARPVTLPTDVNYCRPQEPETK